MTQMLMEFETLDREDIQEIITGAWDVEKKKARLKATENLQKKSPAPAPAKEPTHPTPDTPAPQQA